MLVTEFFDGAVEIGEAELDDELIDQGLRLIRQLWDAGIAHRDIKPANLMVRDDELLVIDVFFVQVRPSPWRQAVDLGNMLLVLALRTDPDRVYQRALAVVHAGRARRGGRGVARRRQPDAAPAVHEARRPRPAGAVSRAGAGAAADRDPALERSARGDRPDDAHRDRHRGDGQHPALPAGPEPGRVHS